MSTVDCSHADAAPAGCVCSHLLVNADTDYCKCFTGVGLAYDLLCFSCMKAPDNIAGQLRSVCEDCFQRIEQEGCWDGIMGLPEVLERPGKLRFTHELVRLAPQFKEQPLDIQPVEAMREPVFVALTSAKEIVSLDLAAGTLHVPAHLRKSGLDFSKPVTLHLSPGGRMAAITNTRGQLGLVIDLTAGKVTMELRRGAYCAYAGNYPLAFFELDGRLLLVHGTEWNRLDVSDPLTGEILTARTFVIPEGAKYPEHGLDYFHCSLSVSPNHEWIVDNGWVWQPFGVPTAWNLRRWVHENVWESEDGPTKRRLSQDFDWDAPCCWIEDRTVVLWGYQDSFNPPIDAVRIYDVTTGRMLRWFAGPAGKLAFDG